ncbi:TPA: 50S ribosomal protein L3 [Candidatus Woesearchaeota archaeon]|nr:50S ribosomal protein L3 [archaeon]HIJ12011.1 50S ribosomal protein L3 [Candidatus Woesearchaeota archaeon]
MAKSRHPRRGSMQFWPRKRSTHSLVRVRSWANESNAKPLGFIGYKVGMTHVMVNDTRAKSHTKGDSLQMASTIVECPPMVVAGVMFYKRHGTGVRKFTSVLAPNLPKFLKKVIQLPKKETKKVDDVTDFDDIRLLVFSNPAGLSVDSKTPKAIEIGIGGSKDDKVAYAKEVLGKELTINDVFETGNPADIHGVTKGKGFQGTVKRFGVPIKQHKGEKIKRGIGNLGAWTPKRVDYRVPQTGKMGYHMRTEYNKQIIKIGENGDEINRKGGMPHYGLVKGAYVLIKGGIVGPRKRPVLLARAIRPTRNTPKQALEITYIAK